MSEQENQEKMVVLPLAVINKVLEALSQRPYAEVSELIDAVRGSAQIISDKGETNDGIE